MAIYDPDDPVVAATQAGPTDPFPYARTVARNGLVGTPLTTKAWDGNEPDADTVPDWWPDDFNTDDGDDGLYARSRKLHNTLPLDWTTEISSRNRCNARFRGWVCTDERGHPGWHSAGDHRRIIAMWPPANPTTPEE